MDNINQGNQNIAPSIYLAPTEDEVGNMRATQMGIPTDSGNGGADEDLGAAQGLGTGTSVMEGNGLMAETALPTSRVGSVDTLALPTVDNPLVSPPMQAVDIPGTGSRRPGRSSSLFSTTSIWNDDSFSLLSSSQTAGNALETPNLHPVDLKGLLGSNGSNNVSINGGLGMTNNMSGGSGARFLSPLLAAQDSPTNSSFAHLLGANTPLNSSETFQRNRSYTTTAVGSRVNSGLPLNQSNLLDPMQSKSFALPYEANNDVGIMLGDNAVFPGGSVKNVRPLNAVPDYVGMNRDRSHTFSGPTAQVPERLFHLHQQNDTMLGQNLSNHSHVVGDPSLLTHPMLQDDFDLTQLMITTSFEKSNLHPTNCLLFDNMPIFLDSKKLWSILKNIVSDPKSLGGVKSIKVSSTSSSKLALMECTKVEIAMNLRAVFNHLEIVPGVIIYVAFAHLISRAETERSTPPSKSSSLRSTDSRKEIIGDTFSEKPTFINLDEIKEPLLSIIEGLTTNFPGTDINKVVSLIETSKAYENENYRDSYGPLPETLLQRQFDSPKLRELRKLLDNTQDCDQLGQGNNETTTGSDASKSRETLSQLEVEEICLAMLPELPELCHDYIGNTVVQRLFSTLRSPSIKLLMVKEISPYLTQLSRHKNGTWAVQKIINLCDENYNQMNVIGKSLKPYAVKLFNDQFGNYVLQGCVKFKSSFNDFMFETLLDNFLEISYGRFGARCIRTILESFNENEAISKEQVALVAGLIVFFAKELAMNSNGSLLVTWFLDTFSGISVLDRYEILTERLLPHLDVLCVHKLASLTILKILNNVPDFKVKQVIMDSIFGLFDMSIENVPPPRLLELILAERPENTSGPMFIYKVMSSPMLLTLPNETSSLQNSRYQQYIFEQIRRVLSESNISNLQIYKKLFEMVGLPTSRLNGSSVSRRRNKRAPRMQHPTSRPYMFQPPLTSAPPYIPVTNQTGVMPNSYPLMLQAQAQGATGNQPLPAAQNPQLAISQLPMSMNGPQQAMFNPDGDQQAHVASQHDNAVLWQLEQLSLSSAALGYGSNPGTPGINNVQRKLFFL